LTLFRSFIACGCLAAIAPVALAQESTVGLDDLRDLSLEELSNLNVTSVLMRPEPISETPASVFVIRNSDIAGIGATNLPDALRLAPNLQVSRDNASSYAITARGFNSFETANKLLVLIDGRSIYAPLHAGVFWDQNPVLMEDVDRIEVVSGPGGATWGSNAVNGVVNVITRDAFATQGFLTRASGGDIDRDAAIRFGSKLNESAAFRVYAQAFDRQNTLTLTGADAGDDFSGVSGGMRFDIDAGDTRWTLQGDVYDHETQNGGLIKGGNALARWSQTWADGGSLRIRAWADHTERSGPGLETETDVADLSFEHVLPPIGAHTFVWGVGGRSVDDSFIASGLFVLDPPQASFNLWSGFVQDTIVLDPTLSLTVGLKLEDSGYSGSEYLPSVRLAFTPDDRTLYWAAISRAVRTPVRLDRDLVAPGIFIGGPNFESEKVIAYEAGYRGRFGSMLSFSASVFLNDYDDLRTTELSSAGGFPAQFLNGYSGTTAGLELWGDYQVADWWRLSAGLAALSKDIDLEAGHTDIAGPPSYGVDPDYQVLLRSLVNLGPDVSLVTLLRYVDDLPDSRIPAYADLDAKLGWRMTPNLELYLKGSNLLDSAHPETDADDNVLQARRSVQAGLAWIF
jgi:iron complex outermembrane receptor protein